jgi:adenine-specific DNA-methyltransferase
MTPRCRLVVPSGLFAFTSNIQHQIRRRTACPPVCGDSPWRTSSFLPPSHRKKFRLTSRVKMPTLDFKGKSFVYAHHLSVPFREIKVEKDKSVQDDQFHGRNGNLIIHGDNLEALKALLPVYAGKIDIVCIDPPYNIGGDWSYDDKVNSPLMREWLKHSANPVERDDLERHEKWLCMMWPRLQLIKELLKNDGILAVTIDDNELFHLGRLLDDIFGEDNCLACAPWLAEPSGGKEKTGLRGGHEYLLIYHNGDSSSITQEIREGGELNLDDKFGAYRKGRELMKWGGVSLRKDRPGQWYPLPAPDGTKAWPIKNDGEEGHWRWGQDNPKIKLALQDPDVFHWEMRPFDAGKSYKGKTKRLVPYEKLRSKEKGVGWGTWLDSHGTNADATRELKEIFGVKVFETPKPIKLFQWLIALHSNIDALVLDSFAGSGTTAHAVLLQNKEDGGNRKFILVQMPEIIPTDKPAYQLGFRQVIDITAERVKRVCNGYAFVGKQYTKLFSQRLTKRALENANDLLEKAESVKRLEGSEYDDVRIEVENGTLLVTGERTIEERANGLGGGFAYCTLGAAMTLEALLEGGLPSYEALAKYVFFTATGRTLAALPPKKSRAEGFIGATENARVHLLYQADAKWLASDAAALTEAQSSRIAALNPDAKRILVFAAAKFLSQRELSRFKIDFCQLPYAIHRLLGD